MFAVLRDGNQNIACWSAYCVRRGWWAFRLARAGRPAAHAGCRNRRAPAVPSSRSVHRIAVNLSEVRSYSTFALLQRARQQRHYSGCRLGVVGI